ncbi:integral membrane protein [Halopolyspora algeriensis]|uniref:Integral membrane protein n=1 Tax=Halopolyspora algeriensis TaxID=1500506 RepID=A0A368VWT0_9ACTN|nr:DUF3817 domain-containing protein [Halopolyspora algeriensis]RCW45198.1 integral membrane protein [Halopolyspora algeriensis]TQM53083.1 integral membrane protein [Halopolyspora algeriensis]
MLRTYVGWFRLVAFAEALSWAGLLIGMVFKYGFGQPMGVTIFGWIHGMVFTAYVVVGLLVYGPLRWKFRVLVLALIASVPPFGTVVFERWATRRELLNMPDTLGPTSWSRLTGALRALN